MKTNKIIINSVGEISIEKHGKSCSMICPFNGNSVINPPPMSWNYSYQPPCSIFCPHCNLIQIQRYDPASGTEIIIPTLILSCGSGIKFETMELENNFEVKQ